MTFDRFLDLWSSAALTSLGFFWMALWAFCLGYLISSMIQVFVTQDRMQKAMGKDGPKSVLLGTFFGFISSSCSFAALSGTRALFQKGAGLVPSLAFLLASTNLVIELGIIIAIFLSWHFVVGEYLGGIILILVMWIVVRLTLPKGLEKAAREHAEEASAGHDHGGNNDMDWRKAIRSREGWQKVANQYAMEWGMVWKDVIFGFTVAGLIAAFVPPSFFQALFIGSGGETDPTWWQTVIHTLIGPVAAFFTFIGSMGNIPLAAVLFGSGVSFAGIMAFIFSDLVVFPVLRITANYFGWKMAGYILAVFLFSLVVTALVLHYGFSFLDLLPSPKTVDSTQIKPSERFQLDYTFVMNCVFLLTSAGIVWLKLSGNKEKHHRHHEHHNSDEECKDKSDHDHSNHYENHNHQSTTSWVDRVIHVLAITSIVWLVIGLAIWFLRG